MNVHRPSPKPTWLLPAGVFFGVVVVVAGVIVWTELEPEPSNVELLSLYRRGIDRSPVPPGERPVDQLEFLRSVRSHQRQSLRPQAFTLLFDPNVEVRMNSLACLRVLAAADAPGEAAPLTPHEQFALIQIIQHDPDPAVQQAALETLGDLTPPSELPALFGLVPEDHPHLQLGWLTLRTERLHDLASARELIERSRGDTALAAHARLHMAWALKPALRAVGVDVPSHLPEPPPPEFAERAHAAFATLMTDSALHDAMTWPADMKPWTDWFNRRLHTRNRFFSIIGAEK